MHPCKFILITSLAISILSCGDRKTGPLVSPANKTTVSEIGGSYDKRYSDDMVQRLYQELLDESKELRSLQERLDRLVQVKADSTEVFSTYNETNESYYRSARNHIQGIRDSVLKRRGFLIRRRK